MFDYLGRFSGLGNNKFTISQVLKYFITRKHRMNFPGLDTPENKANQAASAVLYWIQTTVTKVALFWHAGG